jgi:hypothetical protein
VQGAVEAGVDAALPGFGWLFGLFAKWGFEGLSQEWARLASTALKAAERRSHRSREDIADLIKEDPRLVPLVIRVLFTAGMNGDEEALKAMGAALGEALRDRSRIDEADLLLRSVADLRGEHLLVLKYLSSLPPHDPEERDKGDRMVAKIAEEVGLTEGFTNICAAALVSRGLVISGSTLGLQPFFYMTDLGQILLDVLGELDVQD